MNIAIIGAGISGLTSAFKLQPNHQVTVFEANSYIGGHTNTFDVESHGQTYAVDTGFIVFNDRTYPNFCQLLDELGVASQNTEMSFSVSCEKSGLEYRGADLNGLFAQRKNLFNFKYLRLLKDLLKFNKQSQAILDDTNEQQTVEEYFAKTSYSDYFVQKYFLPMASAIWSCPNGTILSFPIRFIVQFYLHHGLLSVNDRPQWKVITGGSRQYIPSLTRTFKESIHLNTPVQKMVRGTDSVQVTTQRGTESFDHVIFACHSDQALRILDSQATKTEKEILSAFPYEKNIAVLHTDDSVLPKSKRAWACWNYHMHADQVTNGSPDEEKATVTYNMNILQGIESKETFCVTLNCPDRVNPDKVIQRITYHHPIFSIGRSTFQRRQTELIGANRTSYCGAYWGNGFHEDGVASALAVTNHLNLPVNEQKTCEAASTKVG